MISLWKQFGILKLVVILKDFESLASYDTNPLHVEVKTKFILPYLDGAPQEATLAVDYPIKDIPRQLQTNTTKEAIQTYALSVTTVVALIAAVFFWRKSRL